MIRKIVAQAEKYLQPAGYLAMEIGYNQKDAVAELLTRHEYRDIEFELDAADIARVAIGQTKE